MKPLNKSGIRSLLLWAVVALVMPLSLPAQDFTGKAIEWPIPFGMESRGAGRLAFERGEAAPLFSLGMVNIDGNVARDPLRGPLANPGPA